MCTSFDDSLWYKPLSVSDSVILSSAVKAAGSGPFVICYIELGREGIACKELPIVYFAWTKSWSAGNSKDLGSNEVLFGEVTF